jgi:hypothetical protein
MLNKINDKLKITWFTVAALLITVRHANQDDRCCIYGILHARQQMSLHLFLVNPHLVSMFLQPVVDLKQELPFWWSWQIIKIVQCVYDNSPVVENASVSKWMGKWRDTWVHPRQPVPDRVDGEGEVQERRCVFRVFSFSFLAVGKACIIPPTGGIE